MGVGSVGGYWVVLLCGVDGSDEFKDDLGAEGELLGCFVAGICGEECAGRYWRGSVMISRRSKAMQAVSQQSLDDSNDCRIFKIAYLLRLQTKE